MIDLAEVDETDALYADDVTPLIADTRSQSLRYSVLKLMKQSAKHARHAMLRGGAEQTMAMRLGLAGHAMLLGGAEVRIAGGLASENVQAGVKALREGRSVSVYSGAVRRGKTWDEFLAANGNTTILTAREHDQATSIHEQESAGVVLVSEAQYRHAKGITDSLKANEVVQRVILAPGTIYEERIDWTWNGRAWRSTPDARSLRVLAELKTTRCADPEWFHRDALRMSYHVQQALYQRAIEQLTGVRPRTVYLFAVETVEPYVVTPFELSDRSLEHGWRLANEWHEEFLKCESSGRWPGYTDGVAELDVFDPDDEAAMLVERAMAGDDGRRASVDF